MVSDFLKEAPKWLHPIAVMFEHQLEKYGVSARAAMWRSEERQQMRFELLANIIAPEDLKGGITINDLGCGYGAFFDYFCHDLIMSDSRYYGYDIAEKMIDAAQSKITDPRAYFKQSLVALIAADYSFASGPFNYRMEVDETLWLKYVQESLIDLWSQSKKAMAFNMLNKEHARYQDHLYYADAEQFENFCKTELSANVTLKNDYDDEEWTIYVRR